MRKGGNFMSLMGFQRRRRELAKQEEAQKEKEGVKHANNDTPKSKKQSANKRNK
jgi:hypothetical protein